MESWVNIARLMKAKSNEGGLSAQAAEGLPFLLEEGMEVAFVPPVLRVPRRARVVSVQDAGRGRYLVRFDAVASRDDAGVLEGHYCLVREACLPEGWDTSYGAGLVGFTLVDENTGFVGRIAGVAENPAHPLLEVAAVREKVAQEEAVTAEAAPADCAQGAPAHPDVDSEPLALVPLVDEFIVSVDEDSATITVSLPEGLLDLQVSQ